MLIINVDENTIIMHGIIDTLLLNETAVSDLKKKLSTALRQQNQAKQISAMLESRDVRIT